PQALAIYGQILRGKWVADDSHSSAKTDLKLTGVVRPKDGRLILRNRIYEQVFGPAWLREHRPVSPWMAYIPAAMILVFVAGVSVWLAMPTPEQSALKSLAAMDVHADKTKAGCFVIEMPQDSRPEKLDETISLLDNLKCIETL